MCSCSITPHLPLPSSPVSMTVSRDYMLFDRQGCAYSYNKTCYKHVPPKQLDDKRCAEAQSSSLLAPGILALHFLLLLRREVVLDVKPYADLLGRLALNLVRNRLAGQVKQRLDVQVVRRQDQVEERLVINLRFRSRCVGRADGRCTRGRGRGVVQRAPLQSPCPKRSSRPREGSPAPPCGGTCSTRSP